MHGVHLVHLPLRMESSITAFVLACRITQRLVDLKEELPCLFVANIGSACMLWTHIGTKHVMAFSWVCRITQRLVDLKEELPGLFVAHTASVCMIWTPIGTSYSISFVEVQDHPAAGGPEGGSSGSVCHTYSS